MLNLQTTLTHRYLPTFFLRYRSIIDFCAVFTPVRISISANVKLLLIHFTLRLRRESSQTMMMSPSLCISVTPVRYVPVAKVNPLYGMESSCHKGFLENLHALIRGSILHEKEHGQARHFQVRTDELPPTKVPQTRII